jgi:spore coat protein U-like protein
MATVAIVQAEAMHASSGVRIVNDSTALGGKALLVDSAVTVRGNLTLDAPAASLTVRARTDGTAATMVVAVDGEPFPVTTVPGKTWASYTLTRVIPKGNRAVSVKFTNPDARNLYLDAVTFTGSTAPPRHPTPGTALLAYVTGYSWYDNDPPGSAAIAHPTAARTHAGGSGTYNDPITVASGFITVGGITTPDWPFGTRFYLPALRKHGRVEDTCGACHGAPRPPSTFTWLDWWVGGKNATNDQANAAMYAITGTHKVIVNPQDIYVVAPGDIASGGRTPALYGETPILAAD